MRRFRTSEPVDLVIVGAGAGGTVLAQRLARAGWRIVMLEAGPFWDPDQDWVSDEAGSWHLYWTQTRIIGGEDPVVMGANNSGRGVGGSMVHYAGYAPRFHPSDFRIHSEDGVGVDWPIAYEELRPHYQLLESELPVAGEHWPWGDPHGYPHAPHPISGAAAHGWRGAMARGIDMRVGPVATANGQFGNRPHCIYRGFCLQGCKVNAKASPYVTHLPDALAHGVEVRADSMAVRVEIGETGSAIGVTYAHDGSLQHAASGRGRRRRLLDRDATAVAELDHRSTSPRPRKQPGSGRPLRDGAGSAAGGRPIPRNMRMYKAPPPECRARRTTRPTTPAASRAASASRPSARFRSDGPNTFWPTATGVRRCASTCATTTTGRCWAPSASSCRARRTASRSPTNATSTVRRWHGSTTRNVTTTVPASPTRKRILNEIWDAAGAQDVLSIDRYAHLIGGCRMGTSPENSVVDSDHRCWEVPNLFVTDGSALPTQGSANPALTIMALSSRLAERLAARRISPESSSTPVG